jgi:hypothetical protein
VSAAHATKRRQLHAVTQSCSPCCCALMCSWPCPTSASCLLSAILCVTPPPCCGACCARMHGPSPTLVSRVLGSQSSQASCPTTSSASSAKLKLLLLPSITTHGGTAPSGSTPCSPHDAASAENVGYGVPACHLSAVCQTHRAATASESDVYPALVTKQNW